VHLQPMAWRADDWPVIGADADSDGTGEPVLASRMPRVGRRYPSEVPQTSDDFDSTRLGLQWQWQGNDQPGWYSLAAHRGSLRLNAQPLPSDGANLWMVPSLLLQKLPAPAFTASTTVALGGSGDETAGLVVFGMDYAYVALRRSGAVTEIVQARAIDAPKGVRELAGAPVRVNSRSVRLRVTVSDSAMCRFAYSVDGRTWMSLGEPFKAQKGRWVGAKIGLFASSEVKESAYADFPFFHVQ
jgi:beta-xylosidase